MCKACYNCPRRSIEPNCHNVETCPDWAKFVKKKEVEYKARREANNLRGPMARYVKSHEIYMSGPYNPGRRAGG